MTNTVYKIQKGKRIFYVRMEMDLGNGEYIGMQCYKEDGEYLYSKWSSKKSLKFHKSEIVDILEIGVL